MGGVPILLALAAVTVDYGYQPDGKGGVEYIVQVTPEEFEYAKKAGEISSTVDASVRGRVSRFVLRVGSGQLPRDAGPPPNPATVAQAQGFESLADRDHVPIPEIPDNAGDGAAPPIPALAMQTPPPVTRAKPQDAPGMSLPTGSASPLADDAQRRAQALQQMEANARGAVNDAAQQASDLARDAAAAMQDPLRRFQGSGSEAANPMRTAAAAAPPASGPATPFPSTSAAARNNAATSGPAAAQANAATGNNAATQANASAAAGLQLPSTSETGRDNRWARQPSATRPSTNTMPRTASTSGQAAAGNFGTPPPGIADPRLPAAAVVGSQGAQMGNPQPRTQTASSATPTSPTGVAAAATNNGYNYGASGYGNQNGYQGGTQTGVGVGQQTRPNGTQPNTGGTVAGGPPAATAPAYPGTNYPTGSYPTGNYPTGSYPQGTNPQTNAAQSGYPAGPYAQGAYPPNGQLASNYPSGGARGTTGLLPDDLTNVSSSNAPGGAGRPGGASSGANRPSEEEENRGLPQQVFNLLLLLSLIANAYLVIQMSKLIQRYRDLRVNLRAATAGNSPPTPAAA